MAEYRCLICKGTSFRIVNSNEFECQTCGKTYTTSQLSAMLQTEVADRDDAEASKTDHNIETPSGTEQKPTEKSSEAVSAIDGAIYTLCKIPYSDPVNSSIDDARSDSTAPENPIVLKRGIEIAVTIRDKKDALKFDGIDLMINDCPSVLSITFGRISDYGFITKNTDGIPVDQDGKGDALLYEADVNTETGLKKNLYILSSRAIQLPEDSSYMFAHLPSLTSIDFGDCDFSRIKNMSYMFCGCTKLTNLVLDGQHPSNVMDMSYLFASCESLARLDLAGWDTSHVIFMRSLFEDCSMLTDLNINEWDTSEVTDMSSMFLSCSHLTILNIGRWNTSKVTDMSKMFYQCESLIGLDIGNWETSNVTSMSYMFFQCRRLTFMDISNWNTSNVEDKTEMFTKCPAKPRKKGPFDFIFA